MSNQRNLTSAVSDAAGLQSWRWPGKSHGTSATVNYGGADLLHVFSQNAAPFEAAKSYSKFAAFALLNYGGDFRAASAALRAAGYGTPTLPFGRRAPNRRPLRAEGADSAIRQTCGALLFLTTSSREGEK